jgi:hypothetical protein
MQSGIVKACVSLAGPQIGHFWLAENSGGYYISSVRAAIDHVEAA